jgi:hypothetical protein
MDDTTLNLTPAQVQTIDFNRGVLTREEYLRSLIEANRHQPPQTPGSVQRTHGSTTQQQPQGSAGDREDVQT